MIPLNNKPQLQMVWPEGLLERPPSVILPEGYDLRSYQPGDEARFYEIMDLASWPGWDFKKLKPWLHRIIPGGWYMAVHRASNLIAATCMATHDPTWIKPFCAEFGWLATDPAHGNKGLGTAVSAAVTRHFLRSGYQNIHLYSEHYRLSALKIYLKLGYIPFVSPPESIDLWQEICDHLDWPFRPDSWLQ